MLEIAKEDVAARQLFDNPWWEDSTESTVPFEDEKRRKYFASFYRAVADRAVRRAVVLMGPRRVGKTVMVYQAIKGLIGAGAPPRHIMYLSLETPIYTGLPLHRLMEIFSERFGHGRQSPLTIFFDEIQYLKDWEVHLKSLVDSFPQYKFVATGSAAAALRLKSNESGAGRFSDYILPPLSFAEYLMFIGREDELIQMVPSSIPNRPGSIDFTTPSIEALNAEFVNYLNFGGYPEAVFSEAIRGDPSQYIKSDIIDKVLLRDLPSLYGINDIQELNRLFTTIAYNTGQEISLEGLSKSSGVAKNTIKRYLEYLEAAFLIRRVERIDQNARRFKRAMHFKVYLSNPSMRAALFGSIGPESPAMGALTETAVYSQWQHGQAVQLFYARWKDGEVDIVHLSAENQRPEWIVEVKWSDRPVEDTSEIEGTITFSRMHPQLHFPVLVTTRTVTHPTAVRSGIPIDFQPASIYAYSLGANIPEVPGQPGRVAK